jgi:hypothetical protein
MFGGCLPDTLLKRHMQRAAALLATGLLTFSARASAETVADVPGANVR